MIKKIYYKINYNEGFKKNHFLYPLIKKKSYIMDFIFISMIDERGEEYEALSNEFDLNIAWEDANIRYLVLLPLYYKYFKKSERTRFPFNKETMNYVKKFTGKSLDTIRVEIRDFVDGFNVKLYSNHSAYNHVLLYKLFGGQRTIPREFPKFTIDLQQKYHDHIRIASKTLDMSSRTLQKEIEGYKTFPKKPREALATIQTKWYVELDKFTDRLLVNNLKK